jgi:Protein of unknown function (DUF3455)
MFWSWNRFFLFFSIAPATFLAQPLPVIAIQQPIVPDSLRLPSGQQLLFRYFARGVQIYNCQSNNASSTSSYVFREPLAELFDDNGNKIGIHGRGPFWQSIQDGSRVVGTVIASANSPNPLENIPLLLLKATSNEGSGIFSNVNYIQRLDTIGGLAPTSTCNPLTQPSVEVPYTSYYYYSGKRIASIPESNYTPGLLTFAALGAGLLSFSKKLSQSS